MISNPPSEGGKIRVSVLISARNEEMRLAACLSALQNFDEVIVIDSASTDGTAIIAQSLGARVVPFTWNGQYPKKRQWCLDYLMLAHDWIFFVDADEIVTPELIKDIRTIFENGPAHDGYFVDGLYVINDRVLKYGLRNSKLVLFNRHKFKFPVVNDLDIPGMGEMEGHYQPLPVSGATIGSLSNPILHYAYDSGENWESRHRRYAQWEAGMNARNAWPGDPISYRQRWKRIFRALPCRSLIAFLHSYIMKFGFLDGRAGFDLAHDRYRYYAMVARSRQ